MKTVIFTVLTVMVTFLLTCVLIVAVIWFFLIPRLFPLTHLFRATSVHEVVIENRTLGAVAQDIVRQVEAKCGRTIRIIYAPEILSAKIRERDGGASGNPPVEGVADSALSIVACDYSCHVIYVDQNTVLFYIAESDQQWSDGKYH